jgi:hypothetical protein
MRAAAFLPRSKDGAQMQARNREQPPALGERRGRRRLDHVYGNAVTRGARATQADLATFDPDRGGQVRHECGHLAWRRTVVVYLDYRAEHPSASLSEGVMFVARFHGRGYRVWQIAH